MLKRISLQEAANYRKLDDDQFNIATAFLLTPDPDLPNFELVTYYTDSCFLPDKAEWVYILANKHMPGILKIGYTTTSVNQRVFQLNASTGVVSPWVEVYSFKTWDGSQMEAEIHRHLDSMGKRINPSREGFDLDIDAAIKIVEKIGKKYKFEDFEK